MKGENTNLKFVNCEWFACRDTWTLKSFIRYSWFSTIFFVKIDGMLQLKKNFTLKPVDLQMNLLHVLNGLNNLACENRRLFRLLFHPPRKERLQPPTGKKFVWRQYFSINHNSALIFVGLTRVGFSWGSRLQWPTVNEQVSKLEGVINYVVPMGFLEVKNEFEYP